MVFIIIYGEMVPPVYPYRVGIPLPSPYPPSIYDILTVKKGGQSPKQSIRKKNSGKKIREKWDPSYMVGKIPVQYNGLFIVTEHMNLVNILFYWGIVLYKVFLIIFVK